MTPTITSLMKVATALGRSVGYFIEEADPLRPVTVVRRDERAQLYTSKRGLELQNVSGRYGPFFAAGAEAFVEPGADSGPEPMVHPGEELVVLLEGEMSFSVDGEDYDLAGGRLDPLPHRPPALLAQPVRPPGAGDLAGDPQRVGAVPTARLVIAFGGNALIREDERGTWPEQTVHALEAARAIARMGRADEVVLTHGNGPQVGALALQQAIGEPHAPALPLDVLDAMTQGEIGYLLQQALTAVDPSLPTATVLTRVLVADDDPAFAAEPTKPIGAFLRRGRGAARGRRARLARGARRRARLAAHGPQPAAAADPRGRPRAPAGRGRRARHRRRRRRHPGRVARRAPRRPRRRRRQGPLRRRAGRVAARPTCSCS